MISSTLLTTDLKQEVLALEKDLHTRLKTDEAFKAPLRAKYDQAFAAKRTSSTFIAWAEEQITQSAVAWTLATVFIRFLEDNQLIPDPILSGPQERRGLAQDALSHHFMQHPGHSERDYLLHHFAQLRQEPALAELLGPHNALHALHPSADGLKNLIAFWRKIDPASGDLRHDFTDPELNTRFLGDLYQDLSAAARKTYALLQTPLFVEEFILDRTLTPALREFGLATVRLIDPTCGSGHFLLGTFRRLFALWMKEAPTLRTAAVNALRAVHGVDLNPFAVAISRFRLIVEACQACGVKRLAEAPEFVINVAVGDSLLHGRRFSKYGTGIGSQPTLPGSEEEVFRDEFKHHYEVEDLEALHRILGQQYHAVVGNPPYITVKDRALSEHYRAHYLSCRGKYSLSVPFMERFFDLAVKGDGTPQQPAGFIGQITSNSFMKRGFGKKLVEDYLPHWDLTHIIDTAGTYIPGHNSEGTPTVILFAKNQPPVSGSIRAVLGIRGETSTPLDPAQGLVWKAIRSQVDQPGTDSEWISSGDFPRLKFAKHPWSIGGGGASELKSSLDEDATQTVEQLSSSVGYSAIIGDDDIYVAESPLVWLRKRILTGWKMFAIGDTLRNWAANFPPAALYPHDDRGGYRHIPEAEFHFWTYRTQLRAGLFYGKTREERGLNWRCYAIVVKDKLVRPEALLFPFVSTHNHFYYDREGLISNKTAPGVKLSANSGEAEHIAVLGVLNSSTSCFWMRAVAQAKSSFIEAWETRYEFDNAKVKQIPLPAYQPTQLPTALVHTSTALQAQSPAATLASWSGPESGELRTRLATARDQATRLRRQLIAWQEELDWQIYEAFGLLEGAAASGPAAVSLPEGAAVDAIPPEGIELGQRAFEIVLARRMAAGEAQSTWFKRHGSTPITEVPRHWPAPYRELVERRLARIAEDPNIRLIEQPEYKRRWNTEPWDEQFKTAAQNWILARLETYFFESERMEGATSTNALRQSWPAGQAPQLFSLAQLVSTAQADAALMMVMEEYTGTPAFDLTRQISTLLEEASVPYLPSLRYKESGLRKRQAWEETWALQRKEDAIESAVRATPPPEPALSPALLEEKLLQEIKERLAKEVGPIPVPPKYSGSGASSDFKKASYWKLRGKLDVPKERWISYPKLETQAAPSPLYAWAGWNHLQQAQALAALYVDRKDRDGWDAAQLTPLLAGLQDLIPWLQQWHNEEDPDYGMKLGDYFADYVEGERRAHGLTAEAIEQARLG